MSLKCLMGSGELRAKDNATFDAAVSINGFFVCVPFTCDGGGQVTVNPVNALGVIQDSASKYANSSFPCNDGFSGVIPQNKTSESCISLGEKGGGNKKNQVIVLLNKFLLTAVHSSQSFNLSLSHYFVAGARDPQCNIVKQYSEGDAYTSPGTKEGLLYWDGSLELGDAKSTPLYHASASWKGYIESLLCYGPAKAVLQVKPPKKLAGSIIDCIYGLSNGSSWLESDSEDKPELVPGNVFPKFVLKDNSRKAAFNFGGSATQMAGAQGVLFLMGGGFSELQPSVVEALVRCCLDADRDDGAAAFQQVFMERALPVFEQKISESKERVPGINPGAGKPAAITEGLFITGMNECDDNVGPQNHLFL